MTGDLLGIRKLEELKESYRGWVEESLAVKDQGRQTKMDGEY